MSLLVLETCVREIGHRLHGFKPVWVRDQPSQEDIDHIIKEGTDPSPFDPLRLKKAMLDDLRNGKAQLICRRSSLAKVLLVIHPSNANKFPWRLWGKIFQAFGKPIKDAPFWRVVVFANPTPRVFPQLGVEPGPENVNGGYAYPGNPKSVVIYRLEECSRVLVHELLHAAGTDSMENSIEERESLTETWAEIFLIAVQSEGHPRKAAALWKTQRQWVADQEHILEKEHGVNNSTNYASRYTTERRKVFEGLGLSLPVPSPAPRKALNNSLQFTHPSLTQE